MKPHYYYYIIAIIFLAIAIGFFVLIPQHLVKCGDGKCYGSELSFCTLDCKEECLNNTEFFNIPDEIKGCSRGWQDSYYDTLLKENISTDYLAETITIDYSNPIIQSLAGQLKRDSAKETAKAIALWTYNNIRYDSENDFNDCIDAKSSDIIQRGYGICSTQSKVNLALLRANKIPARIVTGCFSYNEYCRTRQTIFRVKIPDIYPIMADESGYVSTRGGLHSFIEIKLPDYSGWTILESTAGLLYEDTCINYRKYYLSEQDMTPDSANVCGLLPINPYVEDCRNFN